MAHARLCTPDDIVKRSISNIFIIVTMAKYPTGTSTYLFCYLEREEDDVLESYDQSREGCIGDRTSTDIRRSTIAVHVFAIPIIP